jgi:hypothetical protein
MFKIKLVGGSLLIAVIAAASPAHAHFKLLMPDSWLNEGDDGAPQKGGPCGPMGYDDVSPTPTSGKVTTFHAGDEVPIEWEITVPHSGFFQVSVAKDRSELKDPDLGEDSFCNYSQPPGDPKYPVLATNIDSGATSTMVKLPDDLTCDKCTLQVIMWMTNHPPGCLYYHCADIQILPKGASGGTGGMGGSAGTSGGGSGGAPAMGSGGMGAGGMSGSGSGGMTAMMPSTSTGAGGSMPMTGSGSGGTPAMTGSGGSSTTVTMGSGGAQSMGGMPSGPVMMTPNESSKKSGCSVAQPGGSAHGAFAAIATALGFARLVRRRRRSSND